jgi:hypothetical protein
MTPGSQTRPDLVVADAMGTASPSPGPRNRFIQLEGAVKSANRDLEEKARTLAGIKDCKANRGFRQRLAAPPPPSPATWMTSKMTSYPTARAACCSSSTAPGCAASPA